MSSIPKGIGSRKRRFAVPETGPFVLRSLLEDVPLSAEGENNDIKINCVEFLGEYAYFTATRTIHDALYSNHLSALTLNF
jgi:hypothetical protein